MSGANNYYYINYSTNPVPGVILSAPIGTTAGSWNVGTVIIDTYVVFKGLK